MSIMLESIVKQKCCTMFAYSLTKLCNIKITATDLIIPKHSG